MADSAGWFWNGDLACARVSRQHGGGGCEISGCHCKEWHALQWPSPDHWSRRMPLTTSRRMIFCLTARTTQGNPKLNQLAASCCHYWHLPALQRTAAETLCASDAGHISGRFCVLQDPGVCCRKALAVVNVELRWALLPKGVGTKREVHWVETTEKT